jgi:hypothetical protein
LLLLQALFRLWTVGEMRIREGISCSVMMWWAGLMGFVTQSPFVSKNIAGSNAMECRDLDDYFCGGLCQSEAVIPMDVARHLLRCEVCRALYHRLRSGCRGVEVKAELQSRILWKIRTSLTQETAKGHRE